MTNPTPNRPLWRAMKHTIYTHDRWSAMIRAVADEVEKRGAKGLDLDPGETADWLRSEADQADADTCRHGMKMAPGQWEAGL